MISHLAETGHRNRPIGLTIRSAGSVQRRSHLGLNGRSATITLDSCPHPKACARDHADKCPVVSNSGAPHRCRPTNSFRHSQAVFHLEGSAPNPVLSPPGLRLATTLPVCVPPSMPRPTGRVSRSLPHIPTFADRHSSTPPPAPSRMAALRNSCSPLSRKLQHDGQLCRPDARSCPIGRPANLR